MNELAELRKRIAELEKSEIGLKRAEEALKKSEILLNETQHITKSGGWEYDVNTSKMTWTEETYRIYGVTPTDYDPNDIRMDIEFYAPMDRLTIESAFRQAVEEGESYDLELKFRNAHGEDIWVRTIGKAERKNGKITRVFGNIVDITERKQMEEALRQSECQFKSTFENAAVGMAHVGLDGRLLRVNDTFCKITGYPPEELVTKTFQEITYPEDLAADVAQAQELAEGRIPYYSMEKRYFCKDGSIVWVNLTVSIQRDHTGQPIHFISIVENISARKLIEEALKESEERYRTMIEYSNDMIWVLDTDGRYQFVNKCVEEFSRLKLDYFLGKSFIQFIDKQDVDRMIDVLHKTLNGEPQHYEITVKALDGNDLTLSVNTAPIYSKGKAVGIVSFGRDITERKKAEEQIKELLKQKLKKSDKQRKLLCYLIEGTRGGKTRALILRHLAEKSYNAHQLAKILKLDYKTIRHHLGVLVKNGIITRRSSDVYPDLYFISKNIQSDLNEMDMEL